ncbi:MFS transporter [Tumebacillus permanentifrigoris]|uniref:YQGE family putative transporter n=1 Tax=Tumebacillus permanentifrigoris TaxID=378543 RepID=A0A316DFY8_9BACL|nr:MFS transporter [Tumebacillus permanentifrigoris]PWK15483.1 YQGE family putative transporter [Tumebacillus permanentifrigoris]
MNRNARVPHDKLPPSGRWLLAVNALFAGASALSSTFLNIYLWKLVRGLEQIALYNLLIFLFTALGYLAAGWLAKRTDRLYTLRLGVLFLAVFYVLILILGPRVGQTYAWLGCLHGTGAGFYWLSMSVLVFEVTEPETRDSFNGANGFLFAVASGIAPLLAGKVLTTLPERGYHFLFLISLALFLAAVLCTWRLKKRKCPPCYDLRLGFNPESYGPLWRRKLLVSFFLGFREGVLVFLPFLLVFLVTRNELTASRYLLMTSVASLIAYYVMKKFLTFERRLFFVTLSALMLAGSVVLLLYRVNTLSLFTFGLLNSLFSPLLMIPYSCLSYDIMGRLPEAEHRKVEYLVVREAAINAGRCLSLGALIACEFWLPDALSNRIAFLIVGFSPLLGMIYFRRSSNEYQETFLKPKL